MRAHTRVIWTATTPISNEVTNNQPTGHTSRPRIGIIIDDDLLQAVFDAAIQDDPIWADVELGPIAREQLFKLVATDYRAATRLGDLIEADLRLQLVDTAFQAGLFGEPTGEPTATVQTPVELAATADEATTAGTGRVAHV